MRKKEMKTAGLPFGWKNNIQRMPWPSFKDVQKQMQLVMALSYRNDVDVVLRTK